VKYGRRKTTTGHYGEVYDKTRHLTRDEFLRSVSGLFNHRDHDEYYFINAQVSDGSFSSSRTFPFFKRDVAQYVMVLDCDSLEHVSAAAHVLTVEGTGYALIESSDCKFWVVTDVVAPIDEIIARIGTYPGVDPNYVSLVGRTRQVPVRAIPLPGRIPKFSVADGLCHPKSKEFYRGLECHYNSTEMTRFLAMRTMAHNLKNGTMAAVMANPQFQV
jgi:hypothetical protein